MDNLEDKLEEIFKIKIARPPQPFQGNNDEILTMCPSPKL